MSKEQESPKPVNNNNNEKPKKYPTKKLAKNRKDGKKWYERAIAAVKKWFREMKSELKKVVWPNKKQIINNTIVVLVMSIVCAVIVWGFDRIASLAVQLLITLTH